MTQRLDYIKIAPTAAKAFGGVHGYVASSGLDATLIDLVYLRVSQINGCAYCIDSHSAFLTKRGVPQEKLLLVTVWRESGLLFTDRERAALAWAEMVTNVAETAIPDIAFAEASKVFDEKELVDLTVGISLINAYNRLAIGFRRPPSAISRLVPSTHALA